MQQKLLDQIEKIESFFKNSKEGKNLNVTQEILFMLMQMIDTRDDKTVTDEMLERLSKLTGFNLGQLWVYWHWLQWLKVKCLRIMSGKQMKKFQILMIWK